MMSHFIHCVRTGQHPKQSARQQLHVHEIMFGAYQSAETGMRYRLTTSFEPFHHQAGPDMFDTKSSYI
jgi:hypothetical protein